MAKRRREIETREFGEGNSDEDDMVSVPSTSAKEIAPITRKHGNSKGSSRRCGSGQVRSPSELEFVRKPRLSRTIRPTWKVKENLRTMTTDAAPSTSRLPRSSKNQGTSSRKLQTQQESIPSIGATFTVPRSSQGSRPKRRVTRKGSGASTADRERIKNLQRLRNESVENTANNLSVEELRQIVTLCVLRHPDVLYEILQLRNIDPGHGPPGSPNIDVPEWCTCTNCRNMTTDLENLCCKCNPEECLSTRHEMDANVLDPLNISLMMRFRQEIYASPFSGDNRSMRHGAYTLYIIMHFQKLGAGNRRVIPSCVVLRIRRVYPDPNGQYSGFQPNRLA